MFVRALLMATVAFTQSKDSGPRSMTSLVSRRGSHRRSFGWDSRVAEDVLGRPAKRRNAAWAEWHSRGRGLDSLRSSQRGPAGRAALDRFPSACDILSMTPRFARR